VHTGPLSPAAPLYGSAPIGQLLVNAGTAHETSRAKHNEDLASTTLPLEICQWMAKDWTTTRVYRWQSDLSQRCQYL